MCIPDTITKQVLVNGEKSRSEQNWFGQAG